MTKEQKFQLAKSHPMVVMKWQRNMTPVQIKAVHLVTMLLKKWMLANDFHPNEEFGNSIRAYDGIKTTFEMSLSEFASAMSVSKNGLMVKVKDSGGENIMIQNGKRLIAKSRIHDYFDQINNIRCKVSSDRYITATDGLQILVNPTYDVEADIVRLNTSPDVAAVLQDASKGFSFVDMQLQMSLNSVMSSHILDRISRFKSIEGEFFHCTVGSLIEQCGISAEINSDGSVDVVRRTFINVNLTRPLKHIVTKSNGVWELIGSGAKVTAKKRGKLQKDDVITFTMKYNDPEPKSKPEVVVDNHESNPTVVKIREMAKDNDPIRASALSFAAGVLVSLLKGEKPDSSMVNSTVTTLAAFDIQPDEEIAKIIMAASEQQP